MTNLLGQTINNYQLIQLLDCGSYAEVYLGEHITSKEKVAFKLFHAYIDNNVKKEQFMNEANLISKLKHPQIVQLLDIGFNDTTPFLIMKYFPNGSLLHIYPKGFILPIEVIIRYVKQIADALQYAHNRNIVHCDIKPENILLDNESNPVLSDFGIAKIAPNSQLQTVHPPEGTPIYMAPEQFKGESPRVESDQYALAVVIYEWLCGQPPFKGKTLYELAGQHLYTPPPSLQSRSSNICAKVDIVILKALAKDSKKRYKSIEEFAKALEEALSSIQQTSQSNNISGQKASLLHQRELFSRRNVTRRTIATSLFLLIGGTAITKIAWQMHFQWLSTFNNPSSSSTLESTPRPATNKSSSLSTLEGTSRLATNNSPSLDPLESTSRSATIQVNRSGLVSNNQASINEIKTQVRNISFLQGRKVALVTISVPTISTKDQDTQQAINIGNKIYDILKTMGKEESAFTNASYGTPGYTSPSPYINPNSAELDIYLFR